MVPDSAKKKWGHLRPGHFRFILTPASDSQRDYDDDATSSSSYEEEDASSRTSFAQTRRKLALAANEMKSMVANGISKAFHHQKDQPKITEEIDPRTPKWVIECGYRILLVGTVPLEGLEKWNDRKKLSESLVENIMTFLNPRSIGKIVRVNRTWANVGYADSLYYDLVQVGQPLARFYAHDDRIETISCYDADTILSSSRQGVVRAFRHDGSSYGAGEDTVVADTTTICRILVASGSLWVASTNGAIREWSMPHDVERIEFKSQLWEHTKIVNGLCEGRGIQSSDATSGEGDCIVSCSDDRTARIWDVVTKSCVAVLRPFSHFSATMCAVCVGELQPEQRFLYIGSSDGKVYVYSTHGEEPQELEQLENGKDVVSSVKTSLNALFVASYDGCVRVWQTATFGGEGPIFALVHTLADHVDRITSLHISQYHVITASDDATIRFYGLYHHESPPRRAERVLTAESRVKCLDVHSVGGILVCG